MVNWSLRLLQATAILWGIAAAGIIFAVVVTNYDPNLMSNDSMTSFLKTFLAILFISSFVALAAGVVNVEQNWLQDDDDT